MKGTQIMEGILMAFVAMVIYAVLLPSINDFIALALPELDDMTGLIIRLFPLAILIGIFMGVWNYFKPSAPQQYYYPG